MDELKPLFDREAEDALIGSLIIDPAALKTHAINAGDLYIDRNRWILEAMQALDREGVTPDFVTLCDELRKRGQLDQCGGATYLTSLITKTPSILYLESYVKIITDYAHRRGYRVLANKLAKMADSEDEPNPGEIIDELVKNTNNNHGAEHWSKALDRLFTQTEERRKNPCDVWGIPTGFIDYDRITGGLQPSEVLYIGGEPGIGKSILSLDMGLNMADRGHPGAIYSLEMGALQVARRGVSALAKMDTRKIKSGRLDDQEWTQFIHFIDRACNLPLYISDDTSLNTSKLRADLARLKMRHGIEWFILDYLYLVDEPSEGKRDFSDTERTATISRRIKAIAKDLDLAGITVSSVTKEGMSDDFTPNQKALRGSGQVLHDADVIGFLTKHIPNKKEYEQENPRLMTFTFSKGRDLQGSGMFHLVKPDTYPAFMNYQPGT